MEQSLPDKVKYPLKVITVANKFIFGLIAFYGVAVFFVFSMMIIISPVFAFLGHSALKEVFVSIACFCQIWVFLPVIELMVYVTWKILMSILEDFTEMKNHEIMIFISILRDYCIHHYKDKRKKAMAALLGQYLIFIITVLCIVYFGILEKSFAGYPLLVILLFSVGFCLYKVFLVQFQCWKGLFVRTNEDSELGDISNPENSVIAANLIDPENIKKEFQNSLVKLKIWRNYIDDSECNPFYALPFVSNKVESTFMWSLSITLVFIMFMFCLIVNIKLLFERFSFSFLIGIIFFVYSAPFLLQFNFFKLFVKKGKFERHQEMKQVFIITFTVISAILLLVIIFIILVNIPNLRLPEQMEYYPPDDPVNTSQVHKHKLSAVCSSKFGPFDIFQMIGFSTIAYEISRNESIYNTTLRYFYGDDWDTILNVKFLYNTPPAKFAHFIHPETQTHIITIRGLNEAPEWALLADLIGGYKIPELLYSHIPGFELILPYVEQLMVEIFEFTRYMFDYRPLVTYYTDPLISYVESQHFQKTDKVFFVGHNNGGVFAKMLSMKFGHESFSVGGSHSMSTTIQGFGIDPVQQQLVTNIISERDFLTATDDSLGTNYILPTVSPVFERNCMYSKFCILSIACDQVNRFNYYCLQTVGMTRYQKMKEYFEREIQIQ